MNVLELTRRLVDIESISGNEEQVGDYVFSLLDGLAQRFGGQVEKQEAEPRRNNILACFGQPVVTLSTHLDTVPPFFPSYEDDDHIWGQGACDVKGIIAAMITAGEVLLSQGTRNLALLFVVGEERNSAGAYHASRHGRGSRYLINGEPTSNQLAIGSKGALRYDVTATGRMAHSAYPELGESAIEKLLDALTRIRSIPMPADPLLGPSTLNVGLLGGGRAPNVIADHASASIMIRLVDDPDPLRAKMQEAVAGLAEAKEVVCIPALRLGSLEDFATTVVSYTTDIPAFGGAWGEPYLLGPGTIHVAHTSEERVPKKELLEAVEIYRRLVLSLLAK
jgi:acetylornithine deacetylase